MTIINEKKSIKKNVNIIAEIVCFMNVFMFSKKVL